MENQCVIPIFRMYQSGLKVIQKIMTFTKHKMYVMLSIQVQKKNVIAINFDQHFTKYKGKTSKHYGVELPDLKAYSTWSWSTKYKNEKKPNGKNEIIVYRKPLPTNMINIPVSAKIQICKENTFQKENYKPDIVKKPLKFKNMANEHKKRCKLKKDVN